MTSQVHQVGKHVKKRIERKKNQIALMKKAVMVRAQNLKMMWTVE